MTEIERFLDECETRHGIQKFEYVPPIKKWKVVYDPIFDKNDEYFNSLDHIVTYFNSKSDKWFT